MPAPERLAVNSQSPRHRERLSTSSVDVAEFGALTPFSSLPVDLLSELVQTAKHHVWRGRATALLNRDFKDRIGVVSTGRVRLVAISNGAGAICIGELFEGDLIGLCTNLLNINAGDNLRICIDRPATIFSVPKPSFLRLMRANASFNSAIVDCLTKTVIDVQTRLFEVAALDVRTRLAGRLLALASRRANPARRPNLISPAPTHAVLAAEIGASREAVSRHVADLQKLGLIKSRHHVIEILDFAGLEALYARAAGSKLFGS